MNVLFLIPLSMSYDAIFSSQNVSIKQDKVKYNREYLKRRLKHMYPMGALSISSYAKKNIKDLNIKLIDFNTVFLNDSEKFDEIDPSVYKLENVFHSSIKLAGEFEPDIIAISSLWTTTFSDLNPLVSFLRKIYGKKIIVCGGHMASTLYKEIYDSNVDIDGLCFGEGELPFVDLLKSENKTKLLEENKQWITKNKYKSYVPELNLIHELDDIPILNLETIEGKEEYFNPHHSFFEIKYDNPRQMFLFTTRGCPYKCTFCASHIVHGRKVRHHSVFRVKEDILEYNKRYGMTKFVIFDDHFLSNKKNAIDILNFIADRGFTAEITTPGFFSIDEDVAKAMKRSGILTTCLTIENGNQDTLRNIIHKPGNLEQAERAIDILHKEGVQVITNILVGFPRETKDSIEKGLEYLMTTNYNWFQIYTVSPLPGSDLYKECVDGGFMKIGNGFEKLTFFSSCVETPEFDSEYINLKVYEMNLKLNFVNNYDIRVGNYEMAFYLFDKLIRTINPNHAFAYYYASLCLKNMGKEKESKEYKDKYNDIVERNNFWKEWSKKLITGA